MDRKYHLDWLRVIAFGLLIPFHVGMLYVGWFYPLKSPRPALDLEWLLMLFTPWRMALVFFISGVASRHLIVKLSRGGYARDRLRRLLPVILFGMLVVNAPQAWIVAMAHGLTHADFLHFWQAYLTGNHHATGMATPRWDHLWFLLYLLAYALLFALIWPVTRRLPGASVTLLAIAPAVWLVVTGMLADTLWPRTDALFNDWAMHLRWAGLFGFGVASAGCDALWTWLEKNRNLLSGLAVLGSVLLLADHALFLRGALMPPFSWLSYDILAGLFGWSVVLALCGQARHWLNRPSPRLAWLNTAVLPVYVLHQPILFAAAWLLFPLRLPLALEAALLITVTLAGAITLYAVAIRPFRATRFLFGLK